MEHHRHSNPSVKQPRHFKLAFEITAHCLLGCGLGEVAGMIVSKAFSLSMESSIAISLFSGFLGGLILGIAPLIKRGTHLITAVRLVIISEGLSIAVMETFEILTQVLIPGVMNADFSDLIFWVGMIAGLTVGFIAAFPVNLFFVKRGLNHHHHK